MKDYNNFVEEIPSEDIYNIKKYSKSYQIRNFKKLVSVDSGNLETLILKYKDILERGKACEKLNVNINPKNIKNLTLNLNNSSKNLNLGYVFEYTN